MAQQLLNAVVLGSILLLFSLGLSLAWGTLDVLNLGHGSIFIFGAYVGTKLGQVGGIPFIAVALLAAIGGGLVAALMEVVAFGPIRNRMRNRQQAELSVLVASIGASMVVNTYVGNDTSHAPFAPGDAVLTTTMFDVLGVRVSNIALIIMGSALVLGVALAWWVQFSRRGRAVRAVAYSPPTAGLVGIDVRAIGLQTMFISGALAGLAGLLLALFISGISTGTGESFMLSAFAILVVGGVGSFRGAILASYLIALAETLVVAYGPAQYRSGIAFALIFLMLLFRPQGIFARQRSQRA